MKRKIHKILPFVAAAMFVASCNDDADLVEVAHYDDGQTGVHGNVVGQTVTIPFSITVGRDARTLSKASIASESELTQIFESDDILVIQGENGKIRGEISISELSNDATTAKFTGNLFVEEVDLTDETNLTATLKNTNAGNEGKAITEIKGDATSLVEAFRKYGYCTASFKYKNRTSISLVQNTGFVVVKMLPFDEPPTFNDKQYSLLENGQCILAVPNNTTLTSNLFSGSKTVDVSTGKVVYRVNRMAKAVDLGLPSGKLWYSCNLGASAPYLDGDYYAWGETETHYTVISNGQITWKPGYNGYDWDNYKWYNGEELTRYAVGDNLGDELSSVELLYSDDAANKVLGDDWCTSSAADWQELYEYCDFQSIEFDGLSLVVVYNKEGGHTLRDPHLMFTSPSYIYGDEFGGGCPYWTSTLSGSSEGSVSNAVCVSPAYWGGGFLVTHYDRCEGRQIRPVKITTRSKQILVSNVTAQVGFSGIGYNDEDW